MQDDLNRIDHIENQSGDHAADNKVTIAANGKMASLMNQLHQLEKTSLRIQVNVALVRIGRA